MLVLFSDSPKISAVDEYLVPDVNAGYAMAYNGHYQERLRMLAVYVTDGQGARSRTRNDENRVIERQLLDECAVNGVMGCRRM